MTVIISKYILILNIYEVLFLNLLHKVGFMQVKVLLTDKLNNKLDS